MMLTPDYRDLLIRHLKAENAHQLAETLATLTEDCIFDDRTLGRVFRGREGAGRYYQMWWDAFGQTVQSERRHVPAPDQCIVEVRFQGRHIGPFLGLTPTGRSIDLPIAIFIDLKDGLMSGERFYWDMATMLRQLGVGQLPALG